jgi:pyruvate ferredoxin oxidoreductase gamma subunit
MNGMQEIRFHGRGGQGAVTTAELIALAAIGEGKYAQAFPSFGPERRGAPVVAYCRISDGKIRIRSKIYKPDVVIVLDPSLMRLVDVEDGLKPDGVLIANHKLSSQALKEEMSSDHRIVTIDATAIAMEVLGRPITNTTMIGAFVKSTGAIEMESLEAPLKERFGRIADRNITAMKKAFDEVKL